MIRFLFTVRHSNWCLFTAAVLLAMGCRGGGQGIQDPVVVTGGLVSGEEIAGTAVRVYKGIPFAAPPVGKLRWQPPQPVVWWEGVLQTTEFSDACTQELQRSRPPWTEAFMHQGNASEDCLYLNVWTAAERVDAQRPVMVWFYGGGFQEGSSAVAVYDGTEFAGNGVVLVSINYRVGLLGFLAHPELTAESPNGSSGNYGFHDQIAALKWVQANIAAFGGDPENVTVFGQSAGAMSVRILLESPLAEGLFARAILQSGAESIPPSYTRTVTTLGQAEQAGLSVQEQLGASALAELRQLPAEDFLIPGALSLTKLEDGWLIPVGGAELRAIPVVAGMVDRDWTSGIDPAESAESYDRSVKDSYGVLASEFLDLYPAPSDSLVMSARRDAIRDRGRIALKSWADRYSESSAAVYTYYFDRAIPWPAQPQFGAFHSGELPYVFNTLDTLDRPWEDADYRLADQMMAYWTNFARIGHPNGDGLPYWPGYREAPGRLLRLGVEPQPIMAGTDRKVRLWEQLLEEPNP